MMKICLIQKNLVLHVQFAAKNLLDLSINTVAISASKNTSTVHIFLDGRQEKSKGFSV